MTALLIFQTILGAMIVISPWIFGYYEVTSALWINTVLGLMVFFTALFGILGREDAGSGNSSSKKV